MNIRMSSCAPGVGLVAGILLSGAAFADKVANNAIFTSASGVQVTSLPDTRGGGTPGIGLSMDVADGGSNVQSWDGMDDADNIVFELDIGVGNAMTGASWDVGIATVGGSWLSEAKVLFSDSTGSADPNWISLTPGSADGAPGDTEYSSGGVIDFGAVPLPDIAVGADGILRLEFFEGLDDNADGVDADWRDAAAPFLVDGLGIACLDQGACDSAVSALVGGGVELPEVQPVPALSSRALGILMLSLLAVGAVVVRRRFNN